MSTGPTIIEQAEATGRIDYIKFIIKTDDQEFQDRYMPVVRSISSWLNKNGRRDGKLTPLGVEAGGLRRYCIEYWGDAAADAAQMVPLTWYNVMYRVDYREEVEVIDSDDLRAMQAYVSVRPSGRTSTSTFTTRPATKTNQRDVGGIGIRFGSRKSDDHAVLYKRGQERTAFEYRRQGKSANELGKFIATCGGQRLEPKPYEQLLREMKTSSARFLNRVLGISNPAQIMQMADEAQAYMPMLFDKGNAEELAEAEAWWSELTEDEQIEWQRQGFGPTLKGQKD